MTLQERGSLAGRLALLHRALRHLGMWSLCVYCLFSLEIGAEGIGDLYNELIFSIVGIVFFKQLLHVVHLTLNMGASKTTERLL